MAETSEVNSSQNLSRQQMIAKVGELIKGIKMAMLTTEAEDGLLHSRPMATQMTEFDGTLWFFTAVSSGKVDELDWNPEVNLSYAQPSESRYVSISGTGEVVDDRGKMQELWNEIYRAWFPQGLEDPNLGLLKIEVSSAEYWEAPSGKMVQILGHLKALATGESLRGEGGEHGTMDIESGRTRGAASGRVK